MRTRAQGLVCYLLNGIGEMVGFLYCNMLDLWMSLMLMEFFYFVDPGQCLGSDTCSIQPRDKTVLVG